MTKLLEINNGEDMANAVANCMGNSSILGDVLNYFNPIEDIDSTFLFTATLMDGSRYNITVKKIS